MRRASAATLAMTMAACGADDGASSADAAAKSVAVTFVLSDFAPGAAGGGAGAPVAGAEVCLIEPNGDCTTSDADGHATVAVPASTKTAVRVTAAGFVTAVAQATSTADDTTVNLFLAGDALAATLAQVVGIAWPDTDHGVVAFNAERAPSGTGMGAAGVSVSIDVSSAGPFYTSAAFVPDTSLTETSTSGLVLLATVTPGDRTISYSHASAECVIGLGWPTGEAGELSVRIERDTVTVATVTCP